MTETYKTKSDLNPLFMRGIFWESDTSYNVRHGNNAMLPEVRSIYFEVGTIGCLGNRLW